MNILNIISRVIVGGIFFVSGLIKANDILGFSYKLEEYFSADVFNMPWMDHFVIPLAILVCVGEIVLGMAVILGAKMRLASWSLFALTVFFGFLTFYSAFYDKVRECGCFGDALSLTPWESFYKDMFLMVFVVILLFSAGKIKLNTMKQDYVIGGLSLILIGLLSIGIFDWTFPVILFIVLMLGAILIKKMIHSKSKEWIMAIYVTVLTLIFGYYTFNYLPVKDYRAYAVGKSIPEQMKTAEELGKPVPEYYFIYTLDKEGEESIEVRSDDYLSKEIWKDKSLKMDKDKTKGPYLLKEGYEPAIVDFKIDSYDGDDLTYEFMDSPEPLLILVFKDVLAASKSGQVKELEGLMKSAEGKINVIGMTPASYDEAEQFRHDFGLAFPFYIGDQIVLKTMVRANPGLILMKEGIVLGKWHINAAPSIDELNALL